MYQHALAGVNRVDRVVRVRVPFGVMEIKPPLFFWRVQIVLLWTLSLLAIFSPLPKADPLWFLVLACSVVCGGLEWWAHEKQCFDNDSRAIDVRYWTATREASEKAKKDTAAVFAEAHESCERAKVAWTDLENYRREWQREVNRHARQTGQPVPFPSVDAPGLSQSIKN